MDLTTAMVKESDDTLSLAGAGPKNQPQAIRVHPAHLPVSQGSPTVPLLTQAGPKDLDTTISHRAI